MSWYKEKANSSLVYKVSTNVSEGEEKVTVACICAATEMTMERKKWGGTSVSFSRGCLPTLFAQINPQRLTYLFWSTVFFFSFPFLTDIIVFVVSNLGHF